MVVEGAASVALDVVGITTMQRNVPDALLARADALISACAVSAVMLGSVLAPVLLSAVGLRAALVVAAVVPGTLVLLLVASLRATPETPEETERRDQVLALIGRIAPLRELAPVPREQLVRSARPVSFAPGETLVVQGDDPEQVWLLATGRCDVRITGADGVARPVAAAVAPDVVGEIGVIERRPRTATVVAESACTGWVVPAQAFREAVSVGQAELPTLRATIGSRLARSLS
jgi:hypothetical protein